MNRAMKILLIDDEPTMHEMAKTFLERVGFTCVSAYGGREGLEKILSEKPDLILLDQRMPDICGTEVFERLRQSPDFSDFRETPVIMLTAFEEEPNLQQRMLEMGLSAYLHKPFGFRELINVIENVRTLHEIRTRNLELQQEIGRTKSYLELLIESAPVGIFSTDRHGLIRQVNGNFACLLDLTEAPIKGASLFSDAVFGKQTFCAELRAAFEAGQQYVAEAKDFITQKGRRIKINIRIVPFTAQMEQTGFIGIIEDVTESERRAHELSLLSEINEAMQGTLEVERLLHLILTSMTAGSALGFSRAMIFTLDREAQMLVGRMGVGPASAEEAQRIWAELAREQLPLQQFLETYGLQPPCDDDLFNTRVKQVRVPLESDSILSQTVRERRPFLVTRGHSYVDPNPALRAIPQAEEFVVVPLIAKGKVIGVVVADNMYDNQPIDESMVNLLSLLANQAALALDRAEAYRRLETKTEQLERAYQQLQEASERLIHSERLATVGKMAAHVAHEIRNPLVTIGGYARHMLKICPNDDAVHRMCQVIADEVMRLENILADVLNFTRLPKPSPKRSDLNQVVVEACHLIEADARKIGVETRTELDTDLPQFFFDPNQIKQVLLNLLQNALQSFESEGTITVATEALEDQVRIRIRDTGSGIPEEVKENMFNPFFTTRPDGTGLGLAICQQIIHDHGGRIRVDSKVAEGTTFTFTLPLCQSLEEFHQSLNKDLVLTETVLRQEEEAVALEMSN
jgi:PAS domain S-box-containing protein